jgi:hypothetical protein
MKSIVENYRVVHQPPESRQAIRGYSLSPKGMIFHILEDNSKATNVLDIGFGEGSLGRLIRSDRTTAHWCVDGIDGFLPNCNNTSLFEGKIYRNIWHGLVQEMPYDRLSQYQIICLLDVIEHLTADTAKWLLRTMLTAMGDNSFLFISTPLWFMPQDHQQEGDLEEHLIGVPATSVMALLPRMYSVSDPLVGGFVFGKESVRFTEFFQPTTDKAFSEEHGRAIARAIGLQCRQGILYKF